MANSRSRHRVAVAKDVGVKVFQKDGWLCQYCGAPVVFAPALRLLQLWVEARLSKAPAYHSKNWGRGLSPLLDWAGAVVDHRLAHSKGGGVDEANLSTSCNKCNGKKSDTDEDVYRTQCPRKRIRAKRGEPTDWDGFSAVFLALANEDPSVLTATERGWLAALESNGPVDRKGRIR